MKKNRARTTLKGPFLFATLLASGSLHAHHAMGGREPANGFEATLGTIAHFVIEPQNLAIIIGAGLLAACMHRLRRSQH
jgi:hydrogenase/urease accessory protein HupE